MAPEFWVELPRTRSSGNVRHTCRDFIAGTCERDRNFSNQAISTRRSSKRTILQDIRSAKAETFRITSQSAHFPLPHQLPLTNNSIPRPLPTKHPLDNLRPLPQQQSRPLHLISLFVLDGRLELADPVREGEPGIGAEVVQLFAVEVVRGEDEVA